MLTFLEFLIESTKENELRLSKQSTMKEVFAKGIKFVPKIHPMARSVERHEAVDSKQWMVMHKNVASELKGLEKGYYLFFSKSLDIGYVGFYNKQRKQFIITTVLPKGRQFPKPGTTKVIVESLECKYIEIE